METSIFTQVYIIDEVLAAIYLPESWANLMIDGQAMVEIGSQLSEICNYNEVINNLSSLFTVEGASTLGGRLAGSAFGEISEISDGYLAASASDDIEAKGFWIGKFTSLVLNYTIR